MSSTYDARPVRSLSLPVCALWKTEPVHAALWIVVLVATVTAVTALARRGPVPSPLLLTVVGLGASYIPGVPEVELSPEVVLVGFLPRCCTPQRSTRRWSTSARNRRADRLAVRGAGHRSTTLAVGLVAWWLLPDRPVAVAFALGAVVAPPDAVAATAVARRVGMPRRMVSILQGESLVNDATALVALRTPWSQPPGRSVSRSGWTSSLAAVGGVAVGLGSRRHGQDAQADRRRDHGHGGLARDPVHRLHHRRADHASGVLAVVVTGLILGHKSHLCSRRPRASSSAPTGHHRVPAGERRLPADRPAGAVDPGGAQATARWAPTGSSWPASR